MYFIESIPYRGFKVVFLALNRNRTGINGKISARNCSRVYELFDKLSFYPLKENRRSVL